MIVGVTGKKNVGKDTVGAYLVKEYGFRRLAAADALKKLAAQIFGIEIKYIEELKNKEEVVIKLDSLTHEFSPKIIGFRRFLQQLGTESRKVLGEDIWINQILPLDGFYLGKNIVVTDIRFENEAQRIRNLEGTLIRINRSSVSTEDTHESEMGSFTVDYTINNDGTIADLFNKVDEIFDDIYQASP